MCEQGTARGPSIRSPITAQQQVLELLKHVHYLHKSGVARLLHGQSSTLRAAQSAALQSIDPLLLR